MHLLHYRLAIRFNIDDMATNWNQQRALLLTLLLVLHLSLLRIVHNGVCCHTTENQNNGCVNRNGQTMANRVGGGVVWCSGD